MLNMCMDVEAAYKEACEKIVGCCSDEALRDKADELFAALQKLVAAGFSNGTTTTAALWAPVVMETFYGPYDEWVNSPQSKIASMVKAHVFSLEMFLRTNPTWMMEEW